MLLVAKSINRTLRVPGRPCHQQAISAQERVRAETNGETAKGDPMNTMQARYPAVWTAAWAALLAAVMTLPLAMLEYVNFTLPLSMFPVTLFVALWVMAALFWFCALSAARLWMHRLTAANVFWCAVAVVGAVVMGTAWLTFVVVQMPCFLGGRGC
jgi:arginine exporter protein ArgO